MGNGRLIGERIRQIREARGWSQIKLGEMSGLAGPTINRIENGHRVGRGDTLKRIAEALDVTMDDLISDISTEVATATINDLSPKERRLIDAWRRGDQVKAMRILLLEGYDNKDSSSVERCDDSHSQ